MITFIKRLVLGIILNAVAIIVCQILFSDFIFKGDLITLIIFAIILTLLNFLLKPILKLIFLPINLLTLGLFNLIINLLLLKTATFFIPDILIISSTLTWIIASLIISIFNSFIKIIK